VRRRENETTRPAAAAATALAAGAASLLVAALAGCATTPGGLVDRPDPAPPTPTGAPAPGPSGDPAGAISAMRCGGDDAALRAAVAASTRVTVRAADLAPARHGRPYSFRIGLTNTAAEPLRATGGVPWVYVTRDGTVVGRLGGAVPAIGLLVDLPAHGSSAPGGYAAGSMLDACSGDERAVDEDPGAYRPDPLPPGEYELWAVMPLTVDPPAASTTDPTPGATDPTVEERSLDAVGGPWSLTIG
jgi:hypothetical protein